MTHLVCVSQQVKTFAIDHLAVNPHRCSVIPNGVDILKYRDALPFDWSEIGWPSESRVAVFVGRFHRQKGIELIQQQCDDLLGGDPERRLLMIGDGPLRGPLADWANRIGRDRVQVLPWQRDVAPFLKAATFLILPSLYEGMANVVLESMAAGRPVVCSRVEGSEELLGVEPSVEPSMGIDGKSTVGNGIDRDLVQGFPVGDGPTMTRLADAFFGDAELCQLVGEANQRHVEKRFSISQMVERYAFLYESLSGGEPGG
jgi:starch synthase (maltosyl-transferring)